MELEAVREAMATVAAGYAQLADCDLDTLTDADAATITGEWELLTRRVPTQTQRMIARLATVSPVELGAKNLREVLRTRLSISGAEARRRIDDAAQLAPRRSLTGEPMAPHLAVTAAAQGAAAIGPEHVRIIRTTMDKLPHWVDLTTREQAEADLVRAATGLDPDALRKVADLLLALIDQDGPEPDDTDRARRRFLTIGTQSPDGMTPIQGLLDPQARATLEAILAKWAAPGMCNPDDRSPCVSGTPSQEQIDADARTIGQRHHDALTAIGRSVLTSGELGQHNGLPTTIIVTTTLQDLQSAAGSAVTGGGSLLPMADVIRMASHAHHYLAIFDKHTNESLYLGRTRRCASPAQRIVLHARDHGCTFPGCTVPGYGTQVHHIHGWAKNNGQTNIDEEVFACGGHNRLAEQGWNVAIGDDGAVEWIPPPQLDIGQARTNGYHHPERILTKPADPDTPG